MLAKLVDEPFNDDDWLFEIKWDGYRSLAFIDKGKVQLKSRTMLDWSKKFPAISNDLKKINHSLILDGELVIIDETGKSDFQLMQNYQKNLKGDLYYYVFDLLFKDGEDLRELPLIERKNRLKKLLKDLSLSHIRFSDHIVGRGIDFFKEAAKFHLEGIIGKKLASVYQSKRSAEWVKIKTALRQEVVICGFTAPRKSRKKFGALLMGIYNNKKELSYVGHVGGGFTAELLDDVYKKLQPLVQTKCPFKILPKVNEPATWVKPKLLCEVSFAEWTKDNIMRQPIFQGLRMDKSPKDVKKEKAIKQVNHSQELVITHPDKIYWPEEKITKGDLVNYYESIHSYILPYLKDRPIMLHRYPEGIEGNDFYQKDINFSHPDWIKTNPVKHEGKIDNYLFIEDLRSLLYAVNLGSIDLHPFLSRYQYLENPDYCVIDLDPHDVSFDKLIECALVTHEILDEIGVDHYCKTSGKKGLHILIPLHSKYDYEQSRQFATVIASYVHERLPKITSMERDPKKRPKKIYLDCLQNRTGQTIVAPYSVRPIAGATVSTPLLWDEIKKGLDISKFNIKTLPSRLKKIGDLFKPVLGKAINMKKALGLLSHD